MASRQVDFNNKSFLPYPDKGEGGSEEMTLYVPTGNTDSLMRECKDDGYVRPFIDSDKHHEYENPAEVARRAGLGRAGSGPRRKANALYGDSKKIRVELPETPTTPNDSGGAGRTPLMQPTSREDSYDTVVKPKRKGNAKLTILIILLTLLSLGALGIGLLNMLNKQADCSCSNRGLKVATVVDESREPVSNPEVLKKLEDLQNKYEDLLKQVENQRTEVRRLNKSGSQIPKVKDGADGKQGPPGPPGPQGDMGPQGVKGDKGDRGFGNISQCTHKTVSKTKKVTTVDAKQTYRYVEYREPQGSKVLSAVCSTTRTKGAGNAYLESVDESNGRIKYKCHCAGTSIYGPFPPYSEIECVLHIWECPVIS